MNIFVYSDESGVFDNVHNNYFVFGGIVFFSKEEKDICARKYSAAEKVIRKKYETGQELKACVISNKDKGKLFRSLNNYQKFGVIINQREVSDEIFANKKTKQRYLDYAYKIAIKRLFEKLLQTGSLQSNSINDIHFFNDEHKMATNGRYELRESIQAELKIGTINNSNGIFFRPIFPDMGNITLDFCDSKKKPLIRAADIIANRIFHYAVIENDNIFKNEKLFLITLPNESIGIQRRNI